MIHFKKITKRLLSVMAASVMAVMIFGGVGGIGGIIASAASEAELPFILKDGRTWRDTSFSVTITGNGDYTADFDLSTIRSPSWGYISGDYNTDLDRDFKNAYITLTGFAINGKEWPLAENTKMKLDLAEDGKNGFFIFNAWNTVTQPLINMDNTVKDGELYSFIGDNGKPIIVTSFTLDFTISGMSYDKPVEEAEDEAVTEAETVEEEIFPVILPIEVTFENQDEIAETMNAPESDTPEENPVTGQSPFIPGIVCVALIGLICTHKRK